MRRIGAALIAAIVAVASGCLGGEPLGGSGLGGAGGSSGGSGGSGGDTVGAGGDRPTQIGTGAGGATCGVETVSLTSSTADVLILMDRSSSMNDNADGIPCTGGCGSSSKWALLSAAVENLLAEYPQINWGLALYGSDNACDVSINALVGVGPGTGSVIASALAGTTPGGEAPTADAITNAVADLQPFNDGLTKYILLISDGHSGCAADEATATAAAATGIGIARTQSGIRTLVLGPAPSGGVVPSTALEQWAGNGGQVSPTNMFGYYTPDDIAYDFVVLPGGNCVLDLPTLPAGPNLGVSLMLNGGTVLNVPQDPTNGWSFTDANLTTVVFTGMSCLAFGQATTATFYYGCGGPIISLGG